VLAPYERAKFANGVSGVVLDALLHGAPVVATSGTWAGDVVDRFDAGIVLRDRTAAQLADAVERILGRWDRYAQNAAKASEALATGNRLEQETAGQFRTELEHGADRCFDVSDPPADDEPRGHGASAMVRL
jgi:glycosyltransferase involved in cell wall biosynthesis